MSPTKEAEVAPQATGVIPTIHHLLSFKFHNRHTSSWTAVQSVLTIRLSHGKRQVGKKRTRPRIIVIGPTYLSGTQLPPAGAPGGPALFAGALRSITLRDQSRTCSESTTRRTNTGRRRGSRKHRNYCNDGRGTKSSPDPVPRIHTATESGTERARL